MQAFGGSGVLSEAENAKKSVQDVGKDIIKEDIVIDTDPQEDVQSSLTSFKDRKGLQTLRDLLPRRFKTRLKKILLGCENYFKD